MRMGSSTGNASRSSVGDELVETGDERTGSTVILITPDSERSMNTYLGANRLYAEEDVNIDTVARARFFHFTGYMWDTDSQQGAIMRALEVAKANNTLVSFDVADPFAVGRYRKAFLSSSASTVTSSLQTARKRGSSSTTTTLRVRRSMGKLCRIAIVKNGKKGSFISCDGVVSSIPVMGPVVPTDTTGAGDVYAAGFLYGQYHGYNVTESGIIASILAGRSSHSEAPSSPA